MGIKGSCLCGGIEYEVSGEVGKVVNCHFSMCRKATGAAFRTRAAISPGAFRWLVGEDLVSKYQSSPGETRTFCRVCGATLPTFMAGDCGDRAPAGYARWRSRSETLGSHLRRLQGALVRDHRWAAPVLGVR
jgi:hypothetical protein